MVAGFYTLSQALPVPEGVLVFLTHLDRMALAAFRPEAGADGPGVGCILYTCIDLM